MDTKKLRQKILDLAIRGKLVPQDPNDEPASVLLERIRAEKEQLIKEGKIKRSKKSEFSDKPHYENVPFEIPKSWEWTTLGDCLSLSSGTNIKVRESAIKGRFPVYGGNGINGYYDQYNVSNKTIVIGRVGFYCGSVHLTNTESWVTDNALIVSHDNMCDTSFLYYSLIWHNLSKTSNSTAQPVVSQKGILPLKTPIPPMSEQKRIVSAIEKYYKVIDSFEKDSVYLRHEISSLKSKILDLAISGKLVPQDPNDEPAIELLKRINPNFVPCDNSHYENLPNGWCVCRLEDICQICDNHRKPINSSERIERKNNAAKLYPYYGATGMVDWIDDFLLDGTYILLGEDGAPFLDKYANKAYIVSGKIWVNNHAHILSPQSDISYLCHYLNTYDYSKCVNGSTRLKLTQADMKNIEILLPPLNEQYRISHKIDYLLNLINTITAEL